MNGRKMFKRKSAKQTKAQTQARQANKQTIESAETRCPRSKKQLKQQRQLRRRHRRLNNDFILDLRIWREFEFILFVYTVKNIPNRICKTASKFTFSQMCRMGMFYVVVL